MAIKEFIKKRISASDDIMGNNNGLCKNCYFNASNQPCMLSKILPNEICYTGDHTNPSKMRFYIFIKNERFKK